MAYPGHGGKQSIQGQTLEVNVVGCKNLRDKEWFSRQDPYVQIEYGSVSHRTRTDTDGGVNPSFNEKFIIPRVEGLREFRATVWNSNSMQFDDYIGSARILIEKAISSGYDDTAWPLKSRTGKYAGELRLIMHYSAAGASKPGKHGAGQVPGAVPGAYPAVQYPAQPGFVTAPAYPPQPGAAGYIPPQQAFTQAPYSTSSYPSAGYPPPPPVAGGHHAPAAYPAAPAHAPYPAAPAHAPYPAAPVGYIPPATAPGLGVYPPAHFPPAPGHAPAPHGYPHVHGAAPYGVGAVAAAGAAAAYGMYSHGKPGKHKDGKKKDKKDKSSKWK